MRTLLSITLVAFSGLANTAFADAKGAASLRAEGTEWVLRTPHGGQLRAADLVGAQLRFTGGAVVHVDSARLEGNGAGRHWWAYELSVQMPSQDWQPLCKPHSDGTHYAIVLPGQEEANGSLTEDPEAFAISCTSGALAKCLRIGYEPWKGTPNGDSMRSAYNACVRMMRADYTGRSIPYTVDGQRIDVYDVHGIQVASELSDQVFEAGWDEHGAVCVHHVRVGDKLTLQELEAAMPRLRSNVGAVCTEAHARKLGALVFNRSSLSRTATD